MKISFILLTSLFLAFSCTENKTQNFSGSDQSQIINGEPVASTHALAPSVVGLMVKYTSANLDGVWVQWCTGSVLSKKLILTAAHCVKDLENSNIAINFSVNTMTWDQQTNPDTRIVDIEKHFVIRKVKGYMLHSLYDGWGTHDLAVIALVDEVPATAKPVTLLPQSYVNKEANETKFEGQSKPVLLMGFGLINEETQADTDVLRSTVVNAEFIKNFVVTDQTHGSGGCNGDSGGPAFLNLDGVYYQVGVTHGPHGNSMTCHEQGEWVNPALDTDFLAEASKKLNP